MPRCRARGVMIRAHALPGDFEHHAADGAVWHDWRLRAEPKDIIIGAPRCHGYFLFSNAPARYFQRAPIYAFGKRVNISAMALSAASVTPTPMPTPHAETCVFIGDMLAYRALS